MENYKDLTKEKIREALYGLPSKERRVKLYFFSPAAQAEFNKAVKAEFERLVAERTNYQD